MKWHLSQYGAFTQIALGLIAGCFPIVFLSLTARLGFEPGGWLFVAYCVPAIAFYWRLRWFPWFIMGSLFCIGNLIPLFFISFQTIWKDIFGVDTGFSTLLMYHLPSLFAADAMGDCGARLAIREKPRNPLSELAVELGLLVMPWLVLGLMKLIGINPLGWPVIIYVVILLAANHYYARKFMINSITRNDPVQSVFGIFVFGIWLYFYSFGLFYCLRDNRFFGSVYSEYTNFNTVAIYYAIMFGGFVLLLIMNSAKINEAINAEIARRQAEDVEVSRWFEHQNELRIAENAAGEVPKNAELAACYELTGLSIKADQADLIKVRQFWERKYDPALTGNYGSSRAEELKKIKAIRKALDNIAKSLSKSRQ